MNSRPEKFPGTPQLSMDFWQTLVASPLQLRHSFHIKCMPKYRIMSRFSGERIPGETSFPETSHQQRTLSTWDVSRMPAPTCSPQIRQQALQILWMLSKEIPTDSRISIITDSPNTRLGQCKGEGKDSDVTKVEIRTAAKFAARWGSSVSEGGSK